MGKEYHPVHKKLLKAGIIAAGSLMFLIVGSLCLYIGITKMTAEEPNITEGLKAIERLEKLDVSKVEETIEALETADAPLDPADETSIKAKFRNTAVMGDSITEGLTVYEILNEENVVSEIGIHLSNTEKEAERASGMNPKYVFLSYGMNDVESTQGDEKVFGEQYRELIAKVKELMPNAEVYVNSILPVQQKVIDEIPYYANLPAYNKELQLICEEEKLTFIDNTSLVKEEFYEPDGIHMGSVYYPFWTAHMAEVAGL